MSYKNAYFKIIAALLLLKLHTCIDSIKMQTIIINLNKPIWHLLALAFLVRKSLLSTDIFAKQSGTSFDLSHTFLFRIVIEN